MTLSSAGEVDQAEDTARHALAEAEQSGNRLAAGYALHALSTVSFQRRDRAAMLANIDRALSLIEAAPQATELRLMLLQNRSFQLAELDRWAEAVATASRRSRWPSRRPRPRSAGPESRWGSCTSSPASGTMRWRS